MLIEKSVKTLENLFSFPQIDAEPNADNTLIFEEILSELEEFLLRENDNADSTDDVFEFLAKISNQIQREFLTNCSAKIPTKNASLKSLSKIFGLLLNTKVNTAEKIKKLIKIALETTVKIWSGQKKQ